MTDEIDLLFPETKTIKIQNRDFVISKLSFGQVLKLLTKIAELINEGQLKFKDLKTINGQNNVADMFHFIQLIGEDKIAGILTIILKTDDLGFCSSLSVEDISEVVLAVCECNDIGKIVKNFSLANKRIKSQQLNLRV